MTCMNRGAFFDLDGTLVPHPSLEARFFWHALGRGLVKPGSFRAWMLWHGLNWATNSGRGMAARVEARNSNKLWLAGIHESSATNWASESASRIRCFPAALARVGWHLAQSDRVFIVSGGLVPIIRAAIQVRPALRGVEICATQLEVSASGTFTGHSRGAAIVGRAKARALARLAALHDIDLGQSFAYANSSADRWFLASVRHAFAVNPDQALTRVAERCGWPVMRWRRVSDAELSLGVDSAHPNTWRELERS